MPRRTPDRTAPATAEDALVHALRARGGRATPQRVVLLRAIRDIGRHASAEEVLDAAAPALPNLSMPTVYATLELFEELGLVRRLQVAGRALYDPRTEGHAHFACRRCGAITDLETGGHAGAARRAAVAAGHQPEAADVVVTGLCRACAGARA